MMTRHLTTRALLALVACMFTLPVVAAATDPHRSKRCRVRGVARIVQSV